MPFRPEQKYFGAEKRRNTANGELFVRLVKIAFGDEATVLVGHHIVYEFGGDLETEDEIPSADTVLFDHPIMTAVFGDAAIPLMQKIAAQLPGEREATVLAALNQLEAAPLAA